MKNVLLALVLLFGVSGITQARPLPTFKVCAEQVKGGWVLYGIPSSNNVDWTTRETVGPMVGSGNCQEGWSEEESVDYRLSSEMPRKFCPSVHSWTLVSPGGVTVKGATSKEHPCRVALPKNTGKPLGSRGKLGTTKTGGNVDNGTSGSGSDNGDSDNGDSDNGNSGNGNSCGGNCGVGNGNGGGNGTGNEGGGNGSPPTPVKPSR